MKNNFFGDPILQPGDDIGAAFQDQHGSADDLTAYALNDDPNFNWSCVIENVNCDEIEAHDFESREALEAWLTLQEVHIDRERG